MCWVFGHGRILIHHALQDIPDEKLSLRSFWEYPLGSDRSAAASAAWALPRSAFMLPIELTARRAIAPMFLRYARTAPRLEPLDSLDPSVASEYIAGSIAFLSFLAAGGLMLLANIG